MSANVDYVDLTTARPGVVLALLGPMTTSTERGDFANGLDKPYSVTLWGSNPDETDNDDCWTGEDFATREEALLAYQSLYKWPLHGLADHCPEWQFAMVDGPDVHDVMANPDERTARRWRRELTRDDRDWQRERAMEAGMLYGVEAYNDALES